jgi:hypothetical protein
MPRALRPRGLCLAGVAHAHRAARVQPALQHRQQGGVRAPARAVEPAAEPVHGQRRARVESAAQCRSGVSGSTGECFRPFAECR